jgi:hypothetical protein
LHNSGCKPSVGEDWGKEKNNYSQIGQSFYFSLLYTFTICRFDFVGITHTHNNKKVFPRLVFIYKLFLCRGLVFDQPTHFNKQKIILLKGIEKNFCTTLVENQTLAKNLAIVFLRSNKN